MPSFLFLAGLCVIVAIVAFVMGKGIGGACLLGAAAVALGIHLARNALADRIHRR